MTSVTSLTDFNESSILGTAADVSRRRAAMTTGAAGRWKNYDIINFSDSGRGAAQAASSCDDTHIRNTFAIIATEVLRYRIRVGLFPVS